MGAADKRRLLRKAQHGADGLREGGIYFLLWKVPQNVIILEGLGHDSDSSHNVGSSRLYNLHVIRLE
jgi:hypothetical protein